MPELPEVETVARQLQSVVAGRAIKAIEILDAKLYDADLVRDPLGHRIKQVRRSGKQVIFELAEQRGRPSLFLVVHLRMTGRLLWHRRSPAKVAHLRAVLTLDKGTVLFTDTRRFGTMRLCREPADFAHHGLEPLSPSLTRGSLAALLQHSRQPIKRWLLRQDKLVGIGNIYASEILFAARIAPDRAAGSLDIEEIGRLHRCLRRILRRAIDCLGTTISDFQTTEGVEGGFARLLKVYGREGEPCRRCRTPIERIPDQGRSTFYCSCCQK
ncbi:MAG: bifunctional DNA-formamidopyrimidine glycosylase/DNA-(apurinic or apyrimidinic site) lyase [Myxococcota bacterium]|nr:bifunctional DNA-formamidopyrimidine glycosylase/DNA-(apurinic or apyrimidinic site) lyase [Myxococcota bacterium]